MRESPAPRQTLPQWNFSGQSAVVTGGGRGLGRRIADALVAAGAEVHIFERDAPADAEGLHVHEVDITDAAALAEVVAGLPRPPLLLVNNAGITRDRTLLKMSDDEWRSVLDVNLTGAFNVLRVLAPAMREAGYGRIVNMASINGLRGKFGQSNYAAAKGGLIALTKSAARELGSAGITLNAIAPGMVMTDMTRTLPPEILDKARGEAVLPWLPDPDDITEAALFLLSDAARCVTGQVIKVDSGQYI
jgi:3-oxoacyl-[acyl-carrier protein] reductase